LEKPLAGKNRMSDFAQFQNYKYISNQKLRFGNSARVEGGMAVRSNFGTYPEPANLLPSIYILPAT
jgi:hypothetical protein